MTDEVPRGRSLAFVSPKGGSGKTVLCASMAYLLRKAGRRVLIIDTDLSTRGISLFLFDRLLEERELNLAPANSVADAVEKGVAASEVTPVPVVKGNCDYEIVLASSDVERGGRPDSKVLGIGSLPNFADRFRELLVQLCSRLAQTYDHILIDTRGGYDASSALAASVADSYLIVVEADRVSKHQLPGLVHAINEAGNAVNLVPRLAGFIVSKATFDPGDDSFSRYLSQAYSSKTFGTIPADAQAINAYQVSKIPLEAHPDSDFAYYSTLAFEKVLSPSLTTSWLDGQRKAFAALLGDTTANWWARVRVERLHAVVPKVQVLLGIAVLITYFAFRSRVPVNVSYFGVLLLGVWFVLSLSAAFVDSAIPLLRGARRRGRLTVVAGGLLVLVGAAYTVFVDAPRSIDRRNLIAEVAEREREIADLRTTMLAFQATVGDTQRDVVEARSELLACSAFRDAAKNAEAVAVAKLTVAESENQLTRNANKALNQTLTALRLAGEREVAQWKDVAAVNGKEIASLRDQLAARPRRGQSIETRLTNIFTVHDGKAGGAKWRFQIFLNREAVNDVPSPSSLPIELNSREPDRAVTFASRPRWVGSFPALLRVTGQREGSDERVAGEATLPDSSVPYTQQVFVRGVQPKDGLMFLTFLIRPSPTDGATK